MMVYVTTVLWCIPSPLFMFLNAEIWVLTQVTLDQGEPWAIALCATIGQMIGYTLCFFAGARILNALPKWKARVERFDIAKYRGAGYAVLLFGCIVGLPPAIVLTFLGRTLNYRFPVFFFVASLGRLIRFETLAMLPETIGPYLRR